MAAAWHVSFRWSKELIVCFRFWPDFNPCLDQLLVHLEIAFFSKRFNAWKCLANGPKLLGKSVYQYIPLFKTSWPFKWYSIAALKPCYYTCKKRPMLVTAVSYWPWLQALKISAQYHSIWPYRDSRLCRPKAIYDKELGCSQLQKSQVLTFSAWWAELAWWAFFVAWWAEQKLLVKKWFSTSHLLRSNPPRLKSLPGQQELDSSSNTCDEQILHLRETVDDADKVGSLSEMLKETAKSFVKASLQISSDWEVLLQNPALPIVPVCRRCCRVGLIFLSVPALSASGPGPGPKAAQLDWSLLLCTQRPLPWAWPGGSGEGAHCWTRNLRLCTCLLWFLCCCLPWHHQVQCTYWTLVDGVYRLHLKHPSHSQVACAELEPDDCC